MKIVLLVLFLTITLSLYGTTYYVSPTGNDAAAGAIGSPWKSWNYAFNRLKAGDILYVRGGTYTVMKDNSYGVVISGKNGTSTNWITVSQYPGDATPILDCGTSGGNLNSNAEHYGINIGSSSYWHFKGLFIENVREYQNLAASDGGHPSKGWEISDGCDHITLEQCTVYNTAGAFTFGGSTPMTNILYLNCDAYYNYDYWDNGGYCNGYSANIPNGSSVTYQGCRAWNNSDDGWDCAAGGGTITYINCWAWRNGYGTPTIGDGDGFKLGNTDQPDVSGIQRTVIGCVSAYNKLMGFDENGTPATLDMNLYNCTAYSNSNDAGFRFAETAGNSIATLRNNISFLSASRRNYEGRSRNVEDHNSWDAGAPTVSNADFVSVDYAQLSNPRQADGSLPVVTFLHLVSGSRLIDAGVDVGFPFGGKAPDLGAFEMQTGSTTPVPVLISAIVENATPSLLEMTYDLNLNNLIAPATSSFKVLVNSVARSVNAVAISGTKVRLTLVSPVVYGDVVTLSYAKPSSNPLQTVSGGQAETISTKSVTNNCKELNKSNNPPVIVIKNEADSYSGFVYEIDASGSYDLDNNILIYEWAIPDNISVSSTTSSKIQFLAPIVNTSQTIAFQLKVTDGIAIVSKSISINILPYKPELAMASIKSIETSSYQTPDYANNASDGNLATKWSAVGDNQWLIFTTTEPFKISHLEIAFLAGQRYSSYFDIYASKDRFTWEPILIQETTCNFSGDLQVLDFPALNTNTAYSYLKYLGHGNSSDTRNNISEFRIFGTPYTNPGSGDNKKINISIYPNPANDFLNISIKETTVHPDKVEIINSSGMMVFEGVLNQANKNVQIPLSLKSGLYFVELFEGNLNLFSQKLIVTD